MTRHPDCDCGCGTPLDSPPSPVPAAPRREQALEGAIEQAWGIIANAWGGDWDKAPAVWKEAAERWRDTHWLAITAPLVRRSPPPAAPQGTARGPDLKCELTVKDGVPTVDFDREALRNYDPLAPAPPSRTPTREPFNLKRRETCTMCGGPADWGASFRAEKERADALEAEAAAMREALEMYIVWQYEDGPCWCPTEQEAMEGHEEFCRRSRAAHSGTAGRALSARLEKLERVAEAARATIYNACWKDMQRLWGDKTVTVVRAEDYEALRAALASLDEAAATRKEGTE